MHTILKLILVVATAVVYTFLILHRPNAPQTTSRAALTTHIIVGLIIGFVFVEVGKLYTTSTVI